MPILTISRLCLLLDGSNILLIYLYFHVRNLWPPEKAKEILKCHLIIYISYKKLMSLLFLFFKAHTNICLVLVMGDGLC